ncbi:hypothetical protein [Phytohalomonas tamaricis]|uniref:hypothetical protein n=1 Tax=Phytohalomonas tamaricis TaxID=2081032 RepID=UPI001319C31B|nr:hypothetical protein [Phytohalomonas tamaricis]
MMIWLSHLWNWIQENATVFSGLTSVGMLLIWGVYLQLLLHNFRMQRRPQIIINRGHGSDVHARCIISNMSEQAVFIQTILVQLETSAGNFISDVTDTTDEQGNLASGESQPGEMPESNLLKKMTRQGPLRAGEYMDAGSFNALIRKVDKDNSIGVNDHCQPIGDVQFKALEVRLVIVFGAERRPIGARRRFKLERSEQGESYLEPEVLWTQQLSSRRQRREVRRWQRNLMS